MLPVEEDPLGVSPSPVPFDSMGVIPVETANPELVRGLLEPRGDLQEGVVPLVGGAAYPRPLDPWVLLNRTAEVQEFGHSLAVPVQGDVPPDLQGPRFISKAT